MKPLIMIFAVMLSGALTMCEDKPITDEDSFEAMVVGKNSDCGLYAIRFTGNIEKANEIAGTFSTQYIFIAANLPAELAVEGLPIVLKIRMIRDNEAGICTDMGPSYPWIWVLEATRKNE